VRVYECRGYSGSFLLLQAPYKSSSVVMTDKTVLSLFQKNDAGDVSCRGLVLESGIEK